MAYVYSAYGRRIRSELALPELASCRDGDSEKENDIVVRLSRVETPPEDAIGAGPLCWMRGNAIWRDFPGACRIVVRDGREILVDPEAGVEERVLRLAILGGGIGLLLFQTGQFVLHASAVAVGAHAVAFMGFSGSGKSTTAAALARHEHAVLTDDIVAVKFASDDARVMPGYSLLKLFPAVAEALGHDVQDMHELHPALPKRGHRAAGEFSQNELPLAAIYILAEADVPAPVIEAVPDSQAIVELIRHAYAAPLLSASAMGPALARYLEQCTRLLKGVQFFRLSRRLSLTQLDMLSGAVLTHIDGVTRSEGYFDDSARRR